MFEASKNNFYVYLNRGPWKKYEFAFCQRFLQELGFLMAWCKNASLKPLGFSNFCEVFCEMKSPQL
jgi:hypothetical protein